MAVRNIRPTIGSKRPIHISSPIPPKHEPVWKLEVVTNKETIDITEVLVDGYYTDGVTSSIGSFEFKILDPNNFYSKKIEEFDTLNIYLDYGTDATTLRFVGKIERLSSQEQIYFTLTGRSVAMITTGTNITYSSNGLLARSEVLKALINKYFNGIVSTDGIEDDLTKIDVNWEETPFWNIVEEICISGGRDAYIDSSLNFQYFIKGGRDNSTEAVVENVNLMDSLDYARDTEEIYTKVRVYGKKIGEIPIFATSSTDTAHTKGIVKDYKINNLNVGSIIQATELANAEAKDKKTPPIVGTIKSLLLPTLSPGERVYIANPLNDIPPAFYQINSFKQVFSEEESPQTELIIQKQRVELATILKSNIKFKSEISENVNKYDLDFSNIITFERDSGTHNNTIISNGRLRVKEGESSGQWTSDILSLDSDMTKLTFMLYGANLTSQYSVYTSNLFYSIDGGIIFNRWKGEVISPKDSSSVIIRMDLNKSSASVKALSILYKL